MNNEKITNKKWFKYIVIMAVILIPFMYAFFYLRAYWNPYGEGNIDNLPVAVINEDKGEKGNVLIDSIKEKKKLKLSVVSEEKAEDGLYDGTYYAIIKIPESFTKDMNSAGSTNKKHATITYSPNKKSNYLASQIINTVVLTVEKNLDNEVNSAVVKNLSTKIEEVPTSLEKVSEGTNKLKDGSASLNDGLNELSNGSLTLKNSYQTFDNGVTNAYDASVKIHNGVKTIKDSVDASLNSMSTNSLSNEQLLAIQNQAKDSVTLNDNQKNQITTGINNSLDMINASSNALSAMNNVTNDGSLSNTILQATGNCSNYMTNQAYIAPCAAYLSSYKTTELIKNALKTQLPSSVIGVAETSAKESAYQTSKVVATAVASNVLSEVNSSMNRLSSGINELESGTGQLESGLYKLNNSSKEVNNALIKLNDGMLKALEGNNKILEGTITFKNEIDKNIESTKKEIKKVEKLSNYSKEPIKIKENDVNNVESYGTAFAPLFISIALWVGSLMFFIILYYDKEKRFKLFGIDSKQIIKRTLLYHVLATITGVVLGILLNLLLDFNITNIFLYYISIILISNTFVAILQFLISNFNDIGKFIGLIILVLQLASSGGTFPIETVSKGFRFLNSFLPMTYTINLLKESLMSIENALLVKNLLIVILIFLVFFIINLVISIKKEKMSK